jgi:drug/metabolite transporter (DMT)-like permease
MPTTALFFTCAAIWGATWIAITFQIDRAAPEVGVALRFTLAAAAALAWCALRALPLRLPAREHRWLALLGLLGFCLAYLLVYHAQRYIVSGLVAVGYSAMPLVNMLLGRLLHGTPMSMRVSAGGLCGLAGIALIFWPELARLDSSRPLAIGAALTAGAVLASSLSNTLVAGQQARGVRGWVPLGFAMAYGAAGSWLAVLLLSGASTQIRWSMSFAAALLYLALAGSVLAFGAYYALIHRIGAARAAYVGVMTTVVALLISALFEGYNWRLASVLGIALAVAGNVLALSGSGHRRSVESSP